MIDEEKIKRRIKSQLAVAEEIKSDFITLTAGTGRKILKLLGERESIKPYIDIDEAKCPNCKVKLTRQELIGDDVLFEDFFDYCPHCGRRVKWNEP